MHIYQDIKNLIFNPYDNHLNICGDHKILLENFLDNPIDENAKTLFRFIAEIHKKNYVFDLLDELKIYEHQFTEILPRHRDHYKHSASVYALGLALYNSCEIFRRLLTTRRHAIDDQINQKASFLFRWSLAAALHDISYPFEMLIKSFNEFSSYINNGGEHHNLIIHPSMLEPYNNILILKGNSVPPSMKKNTSIGLIAQCLLDNEIVANTISIDPIQLEPFIRDTIINDLGRGSFDHGVFSALITLKRINELYSHHNTWDIKGYYYEVVDSATAIFLHNFYKYSKFKDLISCTTFKCSHPNPLGFLLCLCDTLCEWNRSKDIDHTGFRLQADDEEIRIEVPRYIRSKIIGDIIFLNDDLNIIVH